MWRVVTVMQATEMGRWVPELANLTTADTPAYMYVMKYSRVL
jgi:hypothetical protein